MNSLSDKSGGKHYRYAGPQSFYNARSVNERERYLYGYYGFYGPEQKSLELYQELRAEPVACDALTEDCWSKQQIPRVPACVEGFDSSVDAGKSIVIVAIIAALGLFTYKFVCTKK